jgi:hypothetical protein
MPVFKIWHRGSKEVSIEEGRSAQEAGTFSFCLLFD